MGVKQKILVVDDEQDILEILDYNLRKQGYIVFKARNGQEALEKAITVLPDLIILDIRMPEMNGIDVCRNIRKVDELKTTPVLFLTADADEYTSMSALESGGDHFITKPIHPSLLFSMIRECLENLTENDQLS